MAKLTQTRLEWGLLAIVGLAGVGLSYLQYRWTGELSRAERTRLHGSLERQVRQIVQALDGEVRAVAARASRYEKWESGLFGRMAVATLEQGELRLKFIEPGGEQVSAEWPAEWEPLRKGLALRMDGERSGLDLMVMPVRGEAAWMILEPNREYVRKQLLPGYIAEYLNVGAEPEFDVSMSSQSDSRDVIFSTRSDGQSVLQGADITAGLLGGEGRRDGGRRPEWERGFDRRTADVPSAARWVLAVRHRAGSLDAAVDQARTRNLLASFLLIALLAGAASLLVRFTARSRRLSEMQFRFAAGVSHDLRTPLTAIRGAAFNLVHGVVKEPAAMERYLRLILRNSEELTAMVENVMAYTSASQGGKQDVRDRVDLQTLLEQAAATIQSEIEEAGCRLELNVAPELPDVAADRLAIEQAVRNLIGNAVRHAAEGGWIGVSASARDGGVALCVRDRGPGIPKSEQERIFEPFFRGERPLAGRICGAGLGLSLVRDTVQRHGGTVDVESEPGKSAKFSIWLPGMAEET